MPAAGDAIALFDLDGTLADYDAALHEQMRLIQDLSEPPFVTRMGGTEPFHIEARRKLIQRQPGFWRNLEPIPLGMTVLKAAERIGFETHVLTKGPATTPNAWSEKLQWCQKYVPDALVTITQDKSLVYGRVLCDDYPPYFLKWLEVRPRGLVICVSQPWNEGFAKGGPQEHPRVLRLAKDDVSQYEELCIRLQAAYDRKGGSSV